MAETGSKAIKGGRVIDGTGAEPIDNATVHIEGSRIQAVSKDIQAPAGAMACYMGDQTGTLEPGKFAETGNLPPRL